MEIGVRRLAIEVFFRCLQTTDMGTYRGAVIGSWDFRDDGLDDLSHSVIDLIRERQFGDALKACRRLLDEFPEVVDGLDRHATVYEAMGEFAQALDHYQRALDFTQPPEQQDGFDEEGREWRREKIAALEARLGGRSSS